MTIYNSHYTYICVTIDHEYRGEISIRNTKKISNLDNGIKLEDEELIN